eukprot:c19751_g1_i5.p1 GENE.c19751_g1_i5~~c19751_g1_i5.p1  ORF type:complete len:153 (+),score=29.11 c19751_g1_i5:376-834(+)
MAVSGFRTTPKDPEHAIKRDLALQLLKAKSEVEKSCSQAGQLLVPYENHRRGFGVFGFESKSDNESEGQNEVDSSDSSGTEDEWDEAGTAKVKSTEKQQTMPRLDSPQPDALVEQGAKGNDKRGQKRKLSKPATKRTIKQRVAYLKQSKRRK